MQNHKLIPSVTTFTLTYKRGKYLRNNIHTSTLEQAHQEMVALSQQKLLSPAKKLNLHFSDWKEIFYAVFAEIQELTSSLAHPEQGSCFNGNIIIGNKIININLGDSETFSMTLHSHLPTEPYVVNTIHNPNQEAEADRILNAGGIIANGYIRNINGEGLAVSRALGDLHFQSLVSRVPDITFHETPSYGNTYVVISCDGLREGLEHLIPEKAPSVEILIANLIEDYENQGFTAEKMAYALTEMSFKAGSTDNISVVVIPVTQIASQTKYTPLFYAIADGHGGVGVSDLIFQCFIPCLQKHINAKLS
jgi:serine/threonine protein phosphatase PrpC